MRIVRNERYDAPDAITTVEATVEDLQYELHVPAFRLAGTISNR